MDEDSAGAAAAPADDSEEEFLLQQAREEREFLESLVAEEDSVDEPIVADGWFQTLPRTQEPFSAGGFFAGLFGPFGAGFSARFQSRVNFGSDFHSKKKFPGPKRNSFWPKGGPEICWPASHYCEHYSPVKYSAFSRPIL